MRRLSERERHFGRELCGDSVEDEIDICIVQELADAITSRVKVRSLNEVLVVDEEIVFDLIDSPTSRALDAALNEAWLRFMDLRRQEGHQATFTAVTDAIRRGRESS